MTLKPVAPRRNLETLILGQSLAHPGLRARQLAHQVFRRTSFTRKFVLQRVVDMVFRGILLSDAAGRVFPATKTLTSEQRRPTF